MTFNCRVCIGISSTDYRSDDLTEMLPVPMSSGSSNRAKRLVAQKFPLTNLHVFDSERGAAIEITSQARDVVYAVAQHKREFARLAKLVPFDLKVGCYYRPIFNLELDVDVLRTLAAVRASIDCDLYWEDDELVETVPGDFYPCGVLQVSGADWKEPFKWDKVEWGRLIAPSLRRHPGKNQVLTFNTKGGYGRPFAHFSANAVRLLAKSGTSLRMIVEPGWPLLPNPSPVVGTAS